MLDVVKRLAHFFRTPSLSTRLLDGSPTPALWPSRQFTLSRQPLTAAEWLLNRGATDEEREASRAEHARRIAMANAVIAEGKREIARAQAEGA